MDRINGGKFAPGNKLAVGRRDPQVPHIKKLRMALRTAIDEEDVLAIMVKVVEEAKRGDMKAAEMVLDRVFGKPVAMDFEERLAELENLIAEFRGG